jgi:hypothetical protein
MLPRWQLYAISVMEIGATNNCDLDGLVPKRSLLLTEITTNPPYLGSTLITPTFGLDWQVSCASFRPLPHEALINASVTGL